jgi:hypothetical protein
MVESVEEVVAVRSFGQQLAVDDGRGLCARAAVFGVVGGVQVAVEVDRRQVVIVRDPVGRLNDDRREATD